MRLRCWFQGGARFLVWCHWNEQKKTTLRSKYQRSLPFLCSKYLKNCKEILEGVMWMNMFASLKNFRPANWSDRHSSELKASYSAVTPSSFVPLPSLHQSDRWKALDEAGRSLWAPWRRMTTTHWTTLTRTKTLSAQRHASSLLLIQIANGHFTWWQLVIMCSLHFRNFSAFPTWLARTRGSSARNTKSTSGENTGG